MVGFALFSFDGTNSGRKVDSKSNPRSIELFTPAVFYHKIDYIHYNPLIAGLCKFAEGYKYSSAWYYETGVDEFGLFTLLPI